jgi:hypothetical protein
MDLLVLPGGIMKKLLGFAVLVVVLVGAACHKSGQASPPAKVGQPATPSPTKTLDPCQGKDAPKDCKPSNGTVSKGQ